MVLHRTDDAAYHLQLIERIRVGDMAAFEALYHAYYDGLRAFAARAVRDEDRGREVVATVMANLWHRRSALDVRSNPRAYLFSAIRRAVLMDVRTRTRADRAVDAAGRESTPPALGQSPRLPDAILEQRDQSERLWRAVGTLKDPGRTIIFLRWKQEMAFEEIAVILEMTSAAVQMRLSRALKVLRTVLLDRDFDTR